MATGKLGKGFSAFEQPALKQIEQILVDKGRLIKRTQFKRSTYKILGKPQVEDNPEEAESAGSSNVQKEHDPEIFDDDDFYHQMIREVISARTQSCDDPLELGRQWLGLQKLRGKNKKKVDTRASKGRKVR